MTSFFSHLVPFVSIYPGQKNKKGLLQGFLRLFLLRRCLKESTKNITITKFSKNWLDGAFFKVVNLIGIDAQYETFFGIFKHCGFSGIENHSKYLPRGNLTNYYSFHNFQLGHIFVMSQYLKDRQVNRSMTYEAKPFWKSTENWNFYGIHNKALGMHTVSKHIFLFKNTAGQLFEFLAPKLLSNF